MNPVKSYLTALLLTAFASLLIGCAEPASQVLLINNIQGYSFDNNRQLFEFDSIAITKGKVLQAGTSIGTNYPDANIIDGQGKTLQSRIRKSEIHRTMPTCFLWKNS